MQLRSVLLLVVAVLAALSAAKQWDPATDTYCGIVPGDFKPLPLAAEGYRLLDVLHYMRHGARTPTKSGTVYPDDKTVWTDCGSRMWMRPTGYERMSKAPMAFPVASAEGVMANPGNCSLGELTTYGYQQAFTQGVRAGAQMREYFQRAGFPVSLADITLRSTDVHRTRATALSFANGFVEASGADVSASGKMPTMRWVDSEADDLRLADVFCPAAKEYVKEVYAAPAWVKYEQETLAPLKKDLIAALGLAQNFDVSRLFDGIKARLCQRKDLPDAYTVALNDRLRAHMDFYWDRTFFHDHARASTLLTGPLLVEIHAHLTALLADKDARGTAAPQFHLAAGHDFGPIMNLAAALGFFEDGKSVWPSYVQTLALEVLVDGRGALFVRGVYGGEVRAFKGCPASTDKLCRIEDFLGAIAKLLPTEQQCPGFSPSRAFMRTAEALEQRCTHLAAALPTDAPIEAVAAAMHEQAALATHAGIVRARAARVVAAAAAAEAVPTAAPTAAEMWASMTEDL